MDAAAKLAAGAAALGLLWLVTRRRKPRRLPPPQRVLLVGDSLAVGLAAPLGTLVRGSGATFVTAGEGATNGAQWRGRIGPLLAQHRPDLVIVSLGTNDALSPTLRPAFGSNLGQICQQVHAAGARCVWVRAPNRTAVMVQAAQAPLDSGVAVELQGDAIHPTSRGYEAWARSIWSQLG